MPLMQSYLVTFSTLEYQHYDYFSFPLSSDLDKFVYIGGILRMIEEIQIDDDDKLQQSYNQYDQCSRISNFLL